MKCAAGWLIPDEEYRDDYDVPDDAETVDKIDFFRKNFKNVQIAFLRELQDAHDYTESEEEMKEKLLKVAEQYKIDTSFTKT